MRPEQVLERRYRRLLACYPSGYRAMYGEEMLAVAMAAAGPGRRWPDPGEAADLIRSGIRRRLGSLRPGPLSPAWRDAAAAVAIIGPVLMAAFAARPLPVPAGADYGWDWFDSTSFGGIIVAVLWSAVAVAGMLRWRRLALAGCCVLFTGLILDTGHESVGVPYEMGASWWKLLFTVLITGSALLALKSGQRPFSWRAITTAAVVAVLLAALPAIERATVAGPVIARIWTWPAQRAYFSGENHYLHIQAWLSGVLPVGLALILLVAIARQSTAVRPRMIILLGPVAMALALDACGYGIFDTEYPVLFHPTGLPAGLGTWQWPIAIIATPVLCFVIGLTWLSWYERKLRRRGAAGEPE
jgi:hypothetical protein